MKKYKKKNYLLFSILILTLSNTALGEIKEEYKNKIAERIQEGINKIKDIEKTIQYDRTEIVNPDNPRSVGIGHKEKAKIIFNTDVSNSRDYIVFSNEKPEAAYIVNNGTLSSGAHVITTYRGAYDTLYYLENNGKLIALPVDNAKITYITTDNLYVKNSEGASMEGEGKAYFWGYENAAFENAGMLKGADISSSSNLYFINKESGKLDDYSINNYGGDNEDNERFIKNEGVMKNGNIEGKGNLYIENTNLIDGFFSVTGEAENLYFINRKTGKLSLGLTNYYLTDKIKAQDMEFINDGEILSEDEIYIHADKGSFTNNSKIKVKKIIFRALENFYPYRGNVEKFEIDFRNSKVEAEEIVLGRGKGETVVTLDEKSKIIGKIIGNGEADTLKIYGNGVLEAADKYTDFEKLHIVEGTWDLADRSLDIAKNEVLFENSKVNLFSDEIVTRNLYNKDSDLYVMNSFNLQGSLTNDGNIFFYPKDEENFYVLKVMGIYEADGMKGGDYTSPNNKGRIEMRVKADELKPRHDEIQIDGAASGKTAIDINNPNSTLKTRMKEKVKLIATKNSTKDAFYLARDKFGLYKYYLNRVEEEDKVNWYLGQKYFGGVGNIGQSINISREIPNLSLHDHTDYELNLQKNLWVKMKRDDKKSILSNNRDTDIYLKSNLFSAEIGKDLGKVEKEEEALLYGVYGNFATDRTGSIVEGESTTSEMNAFGMGIYSTWKRKNLFLDTWINYSHLNNKIKSSETLKYSLNSLKASVEVAYQKEIPFEKYNLLVRPRWQGVYSITSNPKISEISELKVLGNKNLRSILGLSLTLENENKTFLPFIEYSWINDSKTAGLKIEDETFYSLGSRNTQEIKWGVREIKINENLSLSLRLSHRFGKRGYRINSFEAGFQYRF